MSGLLADRTPRSPVRTSGPAPAGECRATGLRVVVIDPRSERRSLTSSLLNETAAASVVGEGATMVDAMTLMERRDLDVDAVLVEIQMPVEEGLRTIEQIRMRAPHVRIIVCSFWDDVATRALALGAGADGYVAKPINGRDLVTALTASRRATS